VRSKLGRDLAVSTCGVVVVNETIHPRQSSHFRIDQGEP
jgi:hypothetical protein